MAERGSGETLFGVAAIGLGSLIAYGAYRNVPVFGPNGLLTGALRTGKLQPISAKVAQQQAKAQQQPESWWQKVLGLLPGELSPLTHIPVTSTGTQRNPGTPV